MLRNCEGPIGGGSVNIWGGISSGAKTDLVFIFRGADVNNQINKRKFARIIYLHAVILGGSSSCRKIESRDRGTLTPTN